MTPVEAAEAVRLPIPIFLRGASFVLHSLHNLYCRFLAHRHNVAAGPRRAQHGELRPSITYTGLTQLTNAHSATTNATPLSSRGRITLLK